MHLLTTPTNNKPLTGDSGGAIALTIRVSIPNCGRSMSMVLYRTIMRSRPNPKCKSLVYSCQICTIQLYLSVDY
ncbi:MAG: hypothetical protein NHB32_17020 [Fischerella sp. CENA71]|nr:hypothetical protein [Fischerella sp. CENA71]